MIRLESLLILTVLVGLSLQGDIYDMDDSYVINLNPKNFNSQIKGNRSKNAVSLIHFYDSDNYESTEAGPLVEEFAKVNDGMFKAFGLDCTKFREMCEKEGIDKFPTFSIYPPLPAPVIPYENEFNVKKVTAFMSRFVDNKVVELNVTNFDSFKTENVNLPKAILFTDKSKGTPLILKSLSVQFDKKIEIGLVRASENALVKKYKITKFPSIIVLAVGDKRHKTYDGELRFKPLFDWMNIFSETFFKVGEDNSSGTGETKPEKPWLKEKLPELTSLSSHDICLGQDGVICFFVISPGKPESLMGTISELQNYLSPKIDRGIKYKYGWIDTTKQTAVAKALKVESDETRFMLVNPGKRKRFFLADTSVEPSLDHLKKLFERLNAGELRFTMFKGNKFPALVEEEN